MTNNEPTDKTRLDLKTIPDEKVMKNMPFIILVAWIGFFLVAIGSLELLYWGTSNIIMIGIAILLGLLFVALYMLIRILRWNQKATEVYLENLDLIRQSVEKPTPPPEPSKLSPMCSKHIAALGHTNLREECAPEECYMCIIVNESQKES